MTSAHEVREVAVLHHHDFAPKFVSMYEAMARSHFDDAFSYGRHKVNVILERELKRLPSGARILDIGCGTGTYLRRYGELGFQPTGLEPAAGMRERAVADNPGVEVVDGVATSLPFGDATFDFVSAIEVYRYLHIEDTRRSLSECLRVLRPGGILFATLVNRWALDGFYVLQRARQLLHGEAFTRRHPHCEFFTPSQAQRELSGAGFREVRTVGCLAGPMRLAYKVSPSLASRLARRVESIDDFAHEAAVTQPFAGHLIVIGERPR